MSDWSVEHQQSLIRLDVDVDRHLCGRCYKTFYSRSLRISVIIWSVCPWQTVAA
jgi:hypothetical protein